MAARVVGCCAETVRVLCPVSMRVSAAAKQSRMRFISLLGWTARISGKLDEAGGESVAENLSPQPFLYFPGISTATDATHFHVPLTFTHVSKNRSRWTTFLPLVTLSVRNTPTTTAELPYTSALLCSVTACDGA